MRILIQFAIATLVSLVLFWFMHLLIAGGDAVAAKPNPPPPITIVRVKPPEEPPPVRPELPDLPDLPPPRPPETTPTKVDGPDWNPDIRIPKGGEGQRNTLLTLHSDPVPVATLPPQYPQQALRDGITGFVRLEFTIEPDGRVSNARVVQSQPRGVFDQSALRAITQWRFRPKVDGGTPVASRAGYTIEYELDH